MNPGRYRFLCRCEPADQRNYGMALAAMSQYAKSFNVSVSSVSLHGDENDAFDGVMDGKRDHAQIACRWAG
ncbi:MAG: hypothetical protein IPP88_14070 [Betaproteobacteria bacterium]|nr:hypothetical protein [Betaproteobacteria bacterium]